MASKLSNCYTPLPPLKTYSITRTNDKDTGAGDDDSSSDARSYRALRQAHFTVSCFSNATGSSLVELGHTKVVCAVNGPHAAADGAGAGGFSSRGPLEFHSEGKLNCQVSLPPATTTIQGMNASANTNQIDEAELSLNLKDAIYSSVLNLEQFSKSVIDVHVRVLQDDGGILVAAIIAASLALADAGVECCDLVSACNVCVVPSPDSGDKLVCLVDPSEDEIQLSQGYVTVALMPNRKEVTYWDQAGRLQSGITAEAIGICREGCHTVYKLMRQCLKTHSESLQ